MWEDGNCLGFFSRNTGSKNHPGFWLRKLLQRPMLTESRLDSSAGHPAPSSPTTDPPCGYSKCPSGPPCFPDHQTLPSRTSVSAITASIWSGCQTSPRASRPNSPSSVQPSWCSNLRQRELCSRLHSHLLHMVMIQLIHNCVCSLFSCSSDCDLPSSTTDVAKEPQITQNHPLQP